MTVCEKTIGNTTGNITVKNYCYRNVTNLRAPRGIKFNDDIALEN